MTYFAAISELCAKLQTTQIKGDRFLDITDDAVADLVKHVGCAPFEMRLNYRDCFTQDITLQVCDGQLYMHTPLERDFPEGTKLSFVWTEHNIKLAQESTMAGFIEGKTTGDISPADVMIPVDSMELLNNVSENQHYVMTLRTGGVSEVVTAYGSVTNGVTVLRGVDGTEAVSWPSGTCFSVTKIVGNGKCDSADGVVCDTTIKAPQVCVPIFDTSGVSADFGDGNLDDVLVAIFAALAERTTKSTVESCIQTALTGLSMGLTKAQVQQCIEDYISGHSFGLSKAEVQQCIDDAIAQLSYYTRQQVNDLIAGLQNQINNLQEQIDDCDCGGTGTTFIAPTGDFADILSNACPAETTTTVTVTDAVTLSVSTTGGGLVTVFVNGTQVDPSGFALISTSDITIRVDGADGVNEVGTVTLEYDDGAGNTGIVDGIQYDIDCPAVAVNQPPTTTSACQDMTFTVGANVVINFADLFSDPEGDTLAYTTSGTLPAGLVETSTGITGTVSGPAGSYAYSVTATDVSNSATCSFNFIIEEQNTTQTVSLVGNCATDGSSPEPRLWCGVGTLRANGTQTVDIPLGGVTPFTLCGVIFTDILNTVDLGGETEIRLNGQLPASMTEVTFDAAIGGQQVVLDLTPYVGQDTIVIPGVDAVLHNILSGEFTISSDC